MTSQIAKKYALAYFNVAKEENILKKAHSDLKMLRDINSNSKKIFRDINSPISTRSQRLLFINKLLSTYKFHNITKNLLHILAQYRCIDSLDTIIHHYNNFYLDFKKEIKLEIVSTKKINASDLTNIKKFFEKKFTKQVELKNTLDTSILGGIIIKFGSFILDGSTANKIKDIGLTLKEGIQKGV
ncbi:MAG: ATP synthase F1 subunit delta [Rickettsiales bacterium]|nr:ATP synthase F1 subunit delta [Rickettsiales bacterium]